MTHERTILENETPQSLFGKVSPIADTITNLSKGFGEGAEAERGKEERVREVERPATVPERAPVPTPAPAPAPEGKKEAREALPEICREALKKLNTLERQIEEEVKPGLSDLQKKAVTRDKMKTYVEEALQLLVQRHAQDHVYLHGLSSQLDQFKEKLEALEREYKSTVSTYQELNTRLEGIKRGKELKYLSSYFGIDSEEAQQARANFLANVREIASQLKNIESKLNRIIEVLNSYTKELKELEDEFSKRKSEVEKRKEELDGRHKTYEDKLKNYEEIVKKLREGGLFTEDQEDQHPNYVSSKYKAQVEETLGALSYAAKLSKGYEKLAERLESLKGELDKSLGASRETLESVKGYKSLIDELLGKYGASTSN